MDTLTSLQDLAGQRNMQIQDLSKIVPDIKESEVSVAWVMLPTLD